MNEKKICPLLAIANTAPSRCVCAGDRCAWWTISRCAVLDIVFVLDELAQKELPGATNTEQLKETQQDH